MDDKFDDLNLNLNLGFWVIKKRHDEIDKINFFDVQIHGSNIIFPAHRYVLSSRSEFLATQLACGINKLDWTEFKDRTSTALLRWIYTNKVEFSHSPDVTETEQWLDLLHASHKLQLISLFAICERKLLSLDPPFQFSSRCLFIFHYVAQKVESSELLEKCLELTRLNVPAVPPEDVEAKIDEAINDFEPLTLDLGSLDSVYRSEDEDEDFEELLQLNKLSLGYHEFGQFSDVEVTTRIGKCKTKWQAHAHILESRSKNFPKEFKGIRLNLDGIEPRLLRWIYTDCVAFPTLFELCEQAVVQIVDITSCAHFHRIAEEKNATKILKCCNQMITQYFNKDLTWPDCYEMDVDTETEFDDLNSLIKMVVWELLTEDAVDGLLKLNDDCLLHIFRFVSVTDLGSIKDTCKRWRPLADQSFRLYRDKSLTISSSSMFADIYTLKHFGKLITSLKVDSFYERFASLENILELIVQFTGERLKTISFHLCDKIEGERFERLETILKNVERIEIKLNHYSNINRLLSYCENLKEVKLYGRYMKLDADWCSRNPNITKLTMIGLLDDDIVEEICNKLTRLEYLSLENFFTTNKLIHLGRLSSTLRELKINAIHSNSGSALRRFPDKTMLTDLTLSYCRMTKSLANALGDFPNLSHLVFEYRAPHVDDENVLDILSKKLINIECLTFRDCKEITFKAIARVVKNLVDLKKLSVDGCLKIKFININDYLSLQEMGNLQIFLDKHVYVRTCEVIGNNLLDNVHVNAICSE